MIGLHLGYGPVLLNYEREEEVFLCCSFVLLARVFGDEVRRTE
jgi:hypothetical protein